ncbi:C-terminal binding protein [Kaistia dalseonensis]|uniref:D-3-phosphoglycerate dehydrogenase/C-terminal binding protein n=1 Tax=Kaistia dalseonensis TaxID=410840 RepID=A0ABU0H2T9_9HYPH|nr:C-terminal binding protein [Kaistia dalseonensis]MCX5494049.1 C-terminal binding protein [Kaistia dalseonensis]MDQ0436627.1 D-3-phosphoglycerate dehydrogenase/C-terminal binding protein [Kaistia dalseonensis]
MRIFKVNWYPPENEELRKLFGGKVDFDIDPIPTDPAYRIARERSAAADALINCSATHLVPADLDDFERVRIVVREGVGYDNLDLAGWGARGVPVCNVPDYGTTEVADHALALMLSLTRGTSTYGEGLKRDPVANWRFAAAPLIRRHKGATFGVIGLGRIGLAAARRAAAFDMKVVFYDPYLPNGAELSVGYDRVHSLADLMAQSDVVSVHTPLNDETRGFVGAAAFAAAKPGLILVNTARGPIVDLDALHAALRDGRVAGAGLDVLPQEPADKDHPLVKAWTSGEPWLAGRLILTPHAAFYSPDAIKDMQRKAVEVILAYLNEGRLTNCVNREFLKPAVSIRKAS